MLQIIKHCRIVSPDLDLTDGDLVIEQGRIADVGRNLSVGKAQVFDGRSFTAMPGFIDVHCHGRDNCDFCDASPRAVNTIGRGKLDEGVTTVLPTTLTLPREELADTLRAIAAYDQAGAKMPGVHLEGPYINGKCCGAQNPAFVRPPDLDEVKALTQIYPVLKTSFAIETPGGIDFVRQLRAINITPSCVHSNATYAIFEEAFAQGLRNLSHFCNQMTPLHHRDIGLVGAGLLKDEVFLELICDTLHVSPPMIELIFKVKGCAKIELISDAMRAAGMPDGDYMLGGLAVTVHGGAARLKDNGALAGSTLQINRALQNIAAITRLPLKELVKTTSYNQAQSLNLPNLGKLERGYIADIVLLNDHFDVCGVWVDGVKKR